jgi:ABC-type glycerol-3-phosphate transport system substrate-binding protein
MKRAIVLSAAAGLVLLAGCGEKAQTAAAPKNTAKPWQAPKTAFVVPGWTSGDEASWQAQLQRRNQGQNEYSRVLPSR